MGFESIVERVKSIPPLPESVIKVEELYSQKEPNLKALVKIIEEDPVLTANILATVNSPLYFFSKKIVSVHQAVTLFGMPMIRGFILSSVASNSFKVDMSPYGISNKEFQEISNIQSSLMFQWYMSINIEDAATLVPIAFLMDLGKIIIANEISESDYKAEFTQMIKEKDSIKEVEELFAGTSSAKTTALLFEHWNFDEIFINVLRDSDEPYHAGKEFRSMCEAIDVVKTCVNVKHIISEQSFKAAKMKVLGYSLPVDRFIRTVDRIKEKTLSSSKT